MRLAMNNRFIQKNVVINIEVSFYYFIIESTGVKLSKVRMVTLLQDGLKDSQLTNPPIIKHGFKPYF